MDKKYDMAYFEGLCECVAPKLLNRVRIAFYKAEKRGLNVEEAMNEAVQRLNIPQHALIDYELVGYLERQLHHGGQDALDASLALLVVRWCQVVMRVSHL